MSSLPGAVKGCTPRPRDGRQSQGLDVDTMYGQLLRRMPPDDVGVASFAVVVPDEAVRLAERVPNRVRDLLRIRVYGVGEDGTVNQAT
jgi:hypothetical protein